MGILISINNSGFSDSGEIIGEEDNSEEKFNMVKGETTDGSKYQSDIKTFLSSILIILTIISLTGCSLKSDLNKENHTNQDEKIYKLIEIGDMDGVKRILQDKTDFNKTFDRLTPWQVAKIKRRDEIADLLAESSGENGNFPELDQYIDNYIDSSIGENTPAYAVLIARDGEILYKKAFGYAEIENKVEAEANTIFRIGSITKQFVAAAILKLQEDGKLDVQDTLSKYIPDFPRGDEVTIHHLLTHTSGIKNHTSQSDFYSKVERYIDANKLLDDIKGLEFDFDPGEDYSYNNSGYFVLGKIIEIVSGKSLENYFNETFFIPLGMENTGVYINENPPINEAIGYTKSNGIYSHSLNWNMSWAGGAGSLYSTVEDLFLWNEAIFNGNILSQESIIAAHSPARLNNGEVTQYGYGWELSMFRGVNLVEHDGLLDGFRSLMSRIPEDNITIIILTNTNSTLDYLNPFLVVDKLTEFILWESMKPERSYSVMADFDPAILDEYVGRYDYGNGRISIFSTSNGQLFTERIGNKWKLELIPFQKDEFFFFAGDLGILFLKVFRDDSNTITHVITYQSGYEYKGIKLPD
ncbi:MAG: beta-lactamase family protein [bacterium]|nr:beta-lactamase family protein [bacterium]